MFKLLVHKEFFPDEIEDLEDKVQAIVDTIEQYRGTEAENVLRNTTWMMAVTQIENKDEFLIAQHIANQRLSDNE